MKQQNCEIKNELNENKKLEKQINIYFLYELIKSKPVFYKFFYNQVTIKLNQDQKQTKI